MDDVPWYSLLLKKHRGSFSSSQRPETELMVDDYYHLYYLVKVTNRNVTSVPHDPTQTAFYS